MSKASRGARDNEVNFGKIDLPRLFTDSITTSAGALKMNIDRKMVSLFFEIKRNMPYEQREDMKIASHDLGERLVGIYQESDSSTMRMLIEQFMLRAGPKWAGKLSSSVTPKFKISGSQNHSSPI